MRRLAALLALAGVAAGADLAWRPESLQIDVRLRPGEPAALVSSRLGLTLNAFQPQQGRVLWIEGLHPLACRSDGGEPMALLPRLPPRSDGGLRPNPLDLRLQWDISPPRRPAAAILGLSARLRCLRAEGEAVVDVLAARSGERLHGEGAEGVWAEVAEAGAERCALRCSPALARRLARVEWDDADGNAVQPEIRLGPPEADGAMRLSLATTRPAQRIRLFWHAQLRADDIELSIARIEVPGGLPGTAGLVASDPPRLRPLAPDAPRLLQLIAGDQAAEALALVAGGGDPFAVWQGQSALGCALEGQRYALVQDLLAARAAAMGP